MKKRTRSILFTLLVVASALIANFVGAKFASAAIKQVYGVEMPVKDVFAAVIAVTFITGVVKYANRKARRDAHFGRNMAYVGVFQDVWVKWMLESFRAEFPFLKHMRDLSEHVRADVINVREIGADPRVLINNNTYPIPTVERTDNNYAIELDQYETENTPITLKEAQRLDYNKFMTVTKQHQATILEKAQSKWTHALGSQSDAALTPVLECTGADRGDGTKKMTTADLIRFAEACDAIKMPQAGRVLVLSGKHNSDLLAEDVNRYKSLADLKVGQAVDMFSFNVYKSIYTPKYHKGTGVKLAFGAAVSANDAAASIAWHESQVGYAMGSMEMFHMPRHINTANRREEVGFTLNAIGLPLNNKYLGAIYSKQA